MNWGGVVCTWLWIVGGDEGMRGVGGSIPQYAYMGWTGQKFNSLGVSLVNHYYHQIHMFFQMTKMCNDQHWQSIIPPAPSLSTSTPASTAPRSWWWWKWWLTPSPLMADLVVLPVVGPFCDLLLWKMNCQMRPEAHRRSHKSECIVIIINN